MLYAKMNSEYWVSRGFCPCCLPYGFLCISFFLTWPASFLWGWCFSLNQLLLSVISQWQFEFGDSGSSGAKFPSRPSMWVFDFYWCFSVSMGVVVLWQDWQPLSWLLGLTHSRHFYFFPTGLRMWNHLKQVLICPTVVLNLAILEQYFFLSLFS